MVLIADTQADDWSPMAPLLGALSEAGAMMEFFTDCTAGIGRAVGEDTDLLVIDMDSPSIGGQDTLLMIGRAASRVPVLLLSAEVSKARRMWAVEAGVLGYVTKPVDGQALSRFVAKVLKGY
ncbi:MAG TPA: response regulator [Candidatus Aquicultoraceae bacterium]|nr:response regulator [Candidatus Aquicultoraceae bacterium]